MPQWTNVPPTEPEGKSFRLIRTPAAKALVLICTSADLIGCPTHYYRNRTMPCERQACEPCEHGYSKRWHAYVAAIDPTTGEHLIFEMTRQAGDELRDYRLRHGTLRGCKLQATRANNRPNGRLCIRTKPADLATLNLPEPPNIVRVLCNLWDVPYDGITDAGSYEGIPEISVQHPDRLPAHERAFTRGGNGQ